MRPHPEIWKAKDLNLRCPHWSCWLFQCRCLSLVLTSHNCLDLKNTSQHRHHQNPNRPMENVHVAPPPLPPLRRKTENSHLTAFAAFWEIPEMGRTRQALQDVSNCLQPLPAQETKQFVLLLTNKTASYKTTGRNGGKGRRELFFQMPVSVFSSESFPLSKFNISLEYCPI